MSKTAQHIILILVVLFIVALGLALWGWGQKAQLENDKLSLNKQIEDFFVREKGYIQDNKGLKDKVAEIEKAKADLQTQLDKFKDIKLDDIEKNIKELTEQRDEWKKKVDVLSAERDKLVSQLAVKVAVPSPLVAAAVAPAVLPEGSPSTETTQDQDVAAEQQQDAFWADVLKEKADLQLKLENLTATMNATNVELVELKKKNSDIQLALNEMSNDKDAIEREIKHGKDLADSLSLELARAQNEKKFLNDRVGKLLEENSSLHDQIKQLSSTKIALEKSIVRLQDEKKTIEKKLIETENVIQGRVDQIWSIKESLDRDLKPQAKDSGEIELPPIVVSAQTSVANPSVDQNVGAEPGFHGNVVSLNQENNFIIVDIGESEGLRVGDTLSVYRGTEYIAGLEVIQLRKDIAAADIKDKVAEIQVGDVVR